jgi:microcystin-dependent protein
MGDGTDLEDLEVGGWFLCDGRDIDNDLNSNLTQAEQNDLIALFTRSGKHEPGKLPDLRGRFLRGMNKGSGNDPNSGSRTGGNVLGSVQDDAFKSHDHTGSADAGGDHKHSYVDTYYSENNGSAPVQNQKGSGDSDDDNEDWSTTRLTDWSGTHGHTLTINSTGGAETRPKNVYVNYIIKCVK